MSTISVVGGGPGGLFAARLLKRADPSRAVTVYERTVPDDTFGFGVAFTRRTLASVQAADADVFEAIVASSVSMPGQQMVVRGESVRTGAPTGGLGISRSRLLDALTAAACDAGAEVRIGEQVALDEVAGSDLVVAADGAGSSIRSGLDDHFGTRVDPGRGLFMWLGCDRRLDSNLFAPVHTEHGLFNIHCYPYAQDRSTIGVEADEQTWRRAGMDASTDATPATASDQSSIAYLQEVFGEVLGGARLLGNRSRWMRFRVVTAKHWHHGNVVLIGDAAHTAHYSVGSGTKLGLEDAIVLARHLSGAGPASDTPAESDRAALELALGAYEAERRPAVERLQAIALRSQRWWDSLGIRTDLTPARLMLAYFSRAGAVSAEQLAAREPALVTQGLAGYADTSPDQVDLGDATSWILSQPFRDDRLSLPTRLWTGPARTVDGDVDDPWGPAADELVRRCQRLAAAGAAVVRVDGRPGRAALLDRLAACERVVRETSLVVVATGDVDDPGQRRDLADGLVAERCHLVNPLSPNATLAPN